MPIPSAATFRFSSIDASSSSSLTIVLRCSETLFAAAPRPCWASVSRVGMSPPVDPFGGDDAGREAHSEHEPRIRAAAAALLLFRVGPLAELGRRGSDAPLAGALVRRRIPRRARFDEARLELADEVRVVRQRLREL